MRSKGKGTAEGRHPVIGILYESDEWSDWKLARELNQILREEPARQTTDAAGSEGDGGVTVEATVQGAPRSPVLMINVEEEHCVEKALACRMLVSRVFASAPFRGHLRAHTAMEDIIAAAESLGLPLVNPPRAHFFEVDKRLAAEALREDGIAVPDIIAWGVPAALASTASAWSYPCIVKPNCGGRTTHTAVLHSPADAETFLADAPDLVFIVEPFIEAAGGFLTRIEVVDSRIALVVKRSVAASGLSSYHEGSAYELYFDCPAAVTDTVLEAARILDIQFGSFDVIEASEGSFIIDANSVSNVSEDCTELFDFDLMAAYARALAERYRTLQVSAR